MSEQLPKGITPEMVEKASELRRKLNVPDNHAMDFRIDPTTGFTVISILVNGVPIKRYDGNGTELTG